MPTSLNHAVWRKLEISPAQEMLEEQRRLILQYLRKRWENVASKIDKVLKAWDIIIWFDMSIKYSGGVVVSWLVCLSLDQTVRVWALTGDIMLCSWARHYSHSASLTQVRRGEFNAGRWHCEGLASHPGGSRNTPGSLHGTEIIDKHWPTLGSYADCIFIFCQNLKPWHEEFYLAFS